MGNSSLLGSSIVPDPIEHLLPPSYCTHLLASTVMGPGVSLPQEEEEDAGNTGDLVSGPAFTISFLFGHAHAVKTFPSIICEGCDLPWRAGARVWEGFGQHFAQGKRGCVGAPGSTGTELHEITKTRLQIHFALIWCG